MREMTEIKHDTRHPDVLEVTDLVESIDEMAEDDGSVDFDATIVRFVEAKKLIDYVGHISTAIVPWAVMEWLHSWAEPEMCFQIGPLTWLVIPAAEGEPADDEAVHDFVLQAVDRFYINRAGYRPESAVTRGTLEVASVKVKVGPTPEDGDSPGVRFLRWRASMAPERSTEEPEWPEDVQI